MSTNTAKQRKLGVVLGYLTQGIGVISGLVYTPIMLRLLGQSEYGLYQLVSSTVANLSLLNLGFTSSYMRFYAEAESIGEDQIKKINGMFMQIFLGMSVICLICGVVLIQNIETMFGRTMTQPEYEKAKVLFSIAIASMAISFPTSVFTCNLTAHEEFIVQRIIAILQSLLNPFICLPLLLLGYGSIALTCVTALMSVGKLLIESYYCIKKLNMCFSFSNFDLRLFFRMCKFTIFIFLNQIVDIINWNIDKFLLGSIAGLTEVAIYSVGGQINNLYMNFSNLIGGVFAPQINRMVVNKCDDDTLTQLFIKVGRIQYFMVSLICTGFIIFGRSFIYMWVGNEYATSYIVACILMIPMVVPLIQNIGIEIQRAKNKHQVRTIVYVSLSCINLIITYLLIPAYGAVGAAVGTAFALVCGNIIFMNIYYHKRLGINMIEFWIQIIKMSMPMLIALVVGLIGVHYFNITTWTNLFLCIALYVVLYASLFFLFGFNEREKRYVTDYTYIMMKKFTKR